MRLPFTPCYTIDIMLSCANSANIKILNIS